MGEILYCGSPEVSIGSKYTDICTIDTSYLDSNVLMISYNSVGSEYSRMVTTMLSKDNITYDVSIGLTHSRDTDYRLGIRIGSNGLISTFIHLSSLSTATEVINMIIMAIPRTDV